MEPRISTKKNHKANKEFFPISCMCKVPNGFHVCTYYNKAPEVFFFLLLKSFIFNLITLFDDWWFSNSFPSKVHISMTTHHTWLDQDFFSSPRVYRNEWSLFTHQIGSHPVTSAASVYPDLSESWETNSIQRAKKTTTKLLVRKKKKIYATAKSHKWMVGWRMAVGIIWERLSL